MLRVKLLTTKESLALLEKLIFTIFEDKINAPVVGIESHLEFKDNKLPTLQIRVLLLSKSYCFECFCSNFSRSCSVASLLPQLSPLFIGNTINTGKPKKSLS